jgi:hypothetical protein
MLKVRGALGKQTSPTALRSPWTEGNDHGARRRTQKTTALSNGSKGRGCGHAPLGKGSFTRGAVDGAKPPKTAEPALSLSKGQKRGTASQAL